jgi:uncharacterized protein (UPF0248 family)
VQGGVSSRPRLAEKIAYVTIYLMLWWDVADKASWNAMMQYISRHRQVHGQIQRKIPIHRCLHIRLCDHLSTDALRNLRAFHHFDGSTRSTVSEMDPIPSLLLEEL